MAVRDRDRANAAVGHAIFVVAIVSVNVVKGARSPLPSGEGREERRVPRRGHRHRDRELHPARVRLRTGERRELVRAGAPAGVRPWHPGSEPREGAPVPVPTRGCGRRLCG